jgi:hypothetical protein
MEILIALVVAVGLMAVIAVGIAYFFQTAPQVAAIIIAKLRGVKRVGMLAATAVVALASFAQTAVTHAQTATPVPNLSIPTSTIFNEANTWIQVFAPIAAIGIGIAIAIAVLGYVGKMIIGAFK